MICLKKICVGLIVIGVAPLWAQLENVESQPSSTDDVAIGHPEDRMQAPPPVTGLGSPMSFSSEGHTNLLRYGVSVSTAYTDNGVGVLSGRPISDTSYWIAPIIAVHESTPRMDWDTTYAPGFTFYQHTNALNESDQNASVKFGYRLTPRVTFSAEDRFQKTSNILDQPDFGSAAAIPSGSQVPNFSVVAPIASRLSNSGDVSLSYQFGLNQMTGVDGKFANLHYPDASEVPGLYDASSQAGSAFYAFRLSNMHYLGASYQYQRLLSYPTAGLDETQTQAIVLFYTVYPTQHIAVSFFGGPQYSETAQPVNTQAQTPFVRTASWSPVAGGSLTWAGFHTTAALSYSHVIADGGGLMSAVHMDSGAITLGRQLTRTLTASFAGAYTNNKMLGSYFAGATTGHSFYGTASLEKKLGAHLGMQVGYTRLHQNYSGIPLIAANPDTNREFVTLSYQFSRPVGR